MQPFNQYSFMIDRGNLSVSDDSPPPPLQVLSQRAPSKRWIIAIWLLAGVIAAIAAYRTASQYQTPGPFDENRLGFCDFHNGVYFPTKAWLQGDIPYSQAYADSYPVMRQIPLFSPLLFIAHLPLAVLPLSVSEVTYFCLMLLMIVGCGYVFLTALNREFQRRDFAVSSTVQWYFLGLLTLAILFSRAAQTTLLSGYFTFELTLVTLLIFLADDKRSWVASLALAYSSIKPTFAIPLGVLLLAMGRFRIVVRGTIVAIAGAMIGLLWMAVHVTPEDLEKQSSGTLGSVAVVVDSMLNSQDVHRNQNWSRPAVSWTRIDLLGLFAKWTRTDPDDLTHLAIMLLLLAPVCLILWRARNYDPRPGLLGLTTSVAILSVSVSMYKHAYDAIPLMAVALGALLSGAGGWRQMPTGVRWFSAIMASVPLYNYTSTRLFLNRIPSSPWITDLLTSVNSVVVCLLWFLLMYYLAVWTRDQRYQLERPRVKAPDV